MPASVKRRQVASKAALGTGMSAFFKFPPKHLFQIDPLPWILNLLSTDGHLLVRAALEGLEEADDLAESGSQRTTTTNEPLLLCPVRKRVGTSNFVESPLVTACLVTRLQLVVGGISCLFRGPLLISSYVHIQPYLYKYVAKQLSSHMNI